MGGISSGPRTTPVTYVVQQPTVSQASESADNAAESASDETTASEVRSDDLLRRQRGRGGTVLTGFRGLELASSGAANGNGRKTLLGE